TFFWLCCPPGKCRANGGLWIRCRPTLTANSLAPSAASATWRNAARSDCSRSMKSRSPLWLCCLPAIALTMAICCPAQDARIEVWPNQILHRLSPLLTGACLEDVNHEVYGGLYSQLLYGESFQEKPQPSKPGVSGMWRSLRRGDARGEFWLETNAPFLGQQSQGLALVGGQGELGLGNEGLNHWGLNLVKGQPYQGYLWVRAPR